jgi:transposase
MGAMRPPLQLREDYDAPDLRVLAKASRDANQTQRLLALAAIYDGAPRREAAKRSVVSECSPSTSSGVRDWVLAFNGEGPPGLIGCKAPGNQPLLNAEQRAALQRIVEVGRTRRWTGWCAGA